MTVFSNSLHYENLSYHLSQSLVLRGVPFTSKIHKIIVLCFENKTDSLNMIRLLIIIFRFFILNTFFKHFYISDILKFPSKR